MTAVVVPETLSGWRNYADFKSLGHGGALNGYGLYMAEGRLVFASLEELDDYSPLRISLFFGSLTKTFNLSMRKSLRPSKESNLAQLLLAVSAQNSGGIDGQLGFNVVMAGSPKLVPNYIHIPSVVLRGLSGPSAIEVVVKKNRVQAYDGPALPYV